VSSRPSCPQRSTPSPAAPCRPTSRALDSALPRPLQDLNHAPPLLLAQRAGLHDPDAIPFAAGIGLIVGLEALAEAHPLPVEGMAHLPLHQHNHRLVHLVRDDRSEERRAGKETA